MLQTLKQFAARANLTAFSTKCTSRTISSDGFSVRLSDGKIKRICKRTPKIDFVLNSFENETLCELNIDQINSKFVLTLNFKKTIKIEFIKQF